MVVERLSRNFFSCVEIVCSGAYSFQSYKLSCPVSSLSACACALGHEVFLHKSVELNAEDRRDVRRCAYKQSRLSASESGALHPYLVRFEDAVLEGQAAAREAVRLRESGFEPDVIISHAGFGNGLYLKDVFPNSRRIGFFEWYYTSTPGGDVHFLHELHGEKVPLDRAMRLRSWNAVTLLELAQCDALVPDRISASTIPRALSSQFLIHGIDVTKLRSLRTNLPPDHIDAKHPSIRIVTHCSRLELYRVSSGFCRWQPSSNQCLMCMYLLLGRIRCVMAGPKMRQMVKAGVHGRKASGLIPERTHWLGAYQPLSITHCPYRSSSLPHFHLFLAGAA